MGKHLLCVPITLVCIVFLSLIASSHGQAQPITNAMDGITIKRVHIPRDCPIRIEHNYKFIMHYKGYLVDPETNEVKTKDIFDETKGYSPALMQANTRSLLPALYRGILGTCLGEHRTIQIESKYAFGETGFGTVPPNSPVLFSVQILDVTPFTDVFDTIDADMNGCISLEELTTWVVQTGKVAKKDIERTAKRLFDHQDKNKDGNIECEELLTKNKNCAVVVSCVVPPEPEPEPEPEKEETSTGEEASIAELVNGDEHMIENNAEGDEIATA